MSKPKIFWMVFIVTSLVADIALPLWWSLAATLPLVIFSWWMAYRSNWLD